MQSESAGLLYNSYIDASLKNQQLPRQMAMASKTLKSSPSVQWFHFYAAKQGYPAR